MNILMSCFFQLFERLKSFVVITFSFLIVQRSFPSHCYLNNFLSLTYSAECYSLVKSPDNRPFDTANLGRNVKLGFASSSLFLLVEFLQLFLELRSPHVVNFPILVLPLMFSVLGGILGYFGFMIGRLLGLRIKPFIPCFSKACSH